MNKLLLPLLWFGCIVVATAQPVYPPASQTEVDAGTLTSKFVSPATLAGWPGPGVVGALSNFNNLNVTNYAVFLGGFTNTGLASGFSGNIYVAGVVTTPSVNSLGTVITPFLAYQYSVAPALDVWPGGRLDGTNQTWTVSVTTSTNLYPTNMFNNTVYDYYITNAGAFTVTFPGIAPSGWSQFGTNPVFATNSITHVRAMKRGTYTNVWISAEPLTTLVNGNGIIQDDALTAIPVTRTLSTSRLTNMLYAAAMMVDGSTDVFANVTNAIGGNVTLLITNLVIGRSGSLSLLSDGSARTISIYSGPIRTWISTNATSAATNLLTVASKNALLNWSVRAGATASLSTNLHLWAAIAP